MATTRRKFLKVGTLATLFAVTPVRNLVVAQEPDPLANYSKATFKSYLKSIFALQTSAGVVELTLVTIRDMPAPPGGECFTLLFRGGAQSLGQGIYKMSHPSLGTFQLFIVPVGTDKFGAQGYLATINRLSPADAASIVPPTR